MIVNKKVIKMENMIRIPVDPAVHEQLRKIARSQGKNLADFLRDIIQREVGNGLNIRQGIKPRGGRRDRGAS